MFMNDYQTAARKTAMGNSLDHFIMGLCEEAGEAAGVMKRFHRGDEKYSKNWTVRDFGAPSVTRPILSEYGRDKLKGELGDILWYVAMAADELEITLEEIAAYNIAKLKDRQARNVITGSGDNR